MTQPKDDDRFVRQPLSDWLKDRPLFHLYRDLLGEEIIEEWPASFERPNSVRYEDHTYFFVETLPDRSMRHTIRTAFTRNGQLAYEYRVPGGNRFTRSLTREKWEHNEGNIGSDRRKEMKRLGISTSETQYEPKVKNIVEKMQRVKKEKLKEAMVANVRNVLDPKKKKG